MSEFILFTLGKARTTLGQVVNQVKFFFHFLHPFFLGLSKTGSGASLLQSQYNLPLTQLPHRALYSFSLAGPSIHSLDSSGLCSPPCSSHLPLPLPRFRTELLVADTGICNELPRPRLTSYSQGLNTPRGSPETSSFKPGRLISNDWDLRLRGREERLWK